MKIFYHPRFKRAYKKLPIELKSKAEIKEKLFRDDLFSPSLDTHKLHGKLKNQWSFSVGKKYRILFQFYGQDIIFLDIGDHEIYR